MIQYMLIWKFVAEHQPLRKSQLEPGILDRDCAHRRANCTGPGISMRAELQKL